MVVPGLTLFLAIGSTHVPSLTSSLHSYPSVGTYCVDPSVVGNATIKSIFLSVFYWPFLHEEDNNKEF